MALLADDEVVAQRVLDHIARGTTDLGGAGWREPVEHYRSEPRLAAEIEAVLRRHPTPLCPSAALPTAGSYVARVAAGTPILAVRGVDGEVRAFRNACRHRGAVLASGSGCEKVFVCSYHGWTYGLDGGLRHVPHREGFPGLDPSERGLVPVEAVERHGLVFVTQDGSTSVAAELDAIDGLITPEHRLLAVTETEEPANWKVLAETFLEGYHIRFVHRDTFFPVQFDNLNVVEEFGENSRVTFPYRNIAELATLPPAERSVEGRLTYVYHLFPNVMVATFPDRILIVVLEPIAVDRTSVVAYALSDRAPARASSRSGFVLDGAAEDFAVARAVQQGLASGANRYLEFGRFERAIVHFHRVLDGALDQVT